MTRVYGLIGYPLGHSFSRQYHNERFARLGIDAQYNNYPIERIDMLPRLIAETPALEGLNVTIPYKEAVIPYLDQLDATARAIGAVNVIAIARRKDGTAHLTGYNSDYIGFARSFAPLLPDNSPRRALMLGTGGASKAMSAALRDMGIDVTLVSRTPAPGRLTYAHLDHDVMQQHTIIVNATPLGMSPHTEACPPINYDMITSRHICFDAIYNPSTTTFLRRAAHHGATVKNGMEMLLGQADAAWEIWCRAHNERE